MPRPPDDRDTHATSAHATTNAIQKAGLLRRASSVRPEAIVMRRNTTRVAPTNAEQHAWAGGLAGLVAGLLLYPAETVSMRYKVGGQSVLRRIVTTEGPLALWSGAPASMIGTMPSSAMYFVSYEAMKEFGERNVREDAHPLVHMVAGGLSELGSSVVYVPFEVVKARMQLGKDPHAATNGAISARTNYPNSLQAMATIARTEGRAGLYAGFAPCIVTDMSYRGLQFLLYELGKKRLLEWRNARHPQHSQQREPSTTDDLALGFAAGALAAFVSNPFDVVTVRMMTRGLGSVDDRQSRGAMTRAFARIVGEVRREGVRVLFRGAVYRVAALAPHSAVTFAVFEWALRMLGS